MQDLQNPPFRSPRYNYLKRNFSALKKVRRVKARRGVLVNSVDTYRLASKMSQAVLARQAGISRATVHRIETGQTEPAIGIALELARVLDVPVEKLFRID